MSTTRRSFLSSATAATVLPAASSVIAGTPATVATVSPFTFCLNASTIREQTQDIRQQIRIAADAGYDGIEPWMRHLTQYVEAGGSLSDLKKMIGDAGLTVESAIGFAQWIVDDPERRRKGLEDAKRDMDILARIGGGRIAAPPTGATNGPKLDLFVVADRYRVLLEIGDETGVVPQLEVWGHSANLSRLGESVMVCVEASHPQACLLPDVYHIFKGGSEFGGLALLDDEAIHVFHMNDYPDSPVRAEMNDSHRVYPGDGIAPLTEILNMIGGNGRSVALSLELFNRDYWKQDALEVAKTGLAKMKAAVAAAG